MTAPIVCPAGYYCEESCVVPAPCDRGYYCPEGFWLPFECYPGTFNDQFHQSTCKSCPAGYFCPESGTTEPLKCSTDLISSIGATFCQRCPLGHVCSTGIDVGLCPSGGYCTNGDYRSCPAGKEDLNLCKKKILIRILLNLYKERTIHSLHHQQLNHALHAHLVHIAQHNQKSPLNALRENSIQLRASRANSDVKLVPPEVIVQKMVW